MDKLYLLIGVFIGVALSFCFVMAKNTKRKSDISAALCLSMLGVTLFKVDLGDSKTIQSTFDGLIAIGRMTIGKKATADLIDTVADEIGHIMEVDINGEDDSEH